MGNSITELRMTAAKRRQQDAEEVQLIIIRLTAEAASPDRIQKIMAKGREYEEKEKGSRANRNMIKACELMLAATATS